MKLRGIGHGCGSRSLSPQRSVLLYRGAINTDGGCDLVTINMVGGNVAKDDGPTWVFGFLTKFGVGDATWLEVLAMMEELNLMKARGFKKV
ncbi:hypothetical protein RJT34_15440 [Clitoria ternatea]|uniref:Uncharacterized protein n=1 Tax=Clitoria ternatea TaxID=43366 RepID=A0AAN9J6D2_CLITE